MRALRPFRIFDIFRTIPAGAPSMTSPVGYQTADGAFFATADSIIFGTAS